MNKSLIIGIIAIAVIVGGVFLYTKNSSAPTATSASIYCSSDGTFTDTKPIQSHRSYCLQSLSSVDNLKPNAPVAYSFRIIDDQGNTLKDFDTVHEKIMHFIAVRKDLVEFQHVHPDFNASTGVFTLPDLTFRSDGIFRLFADYTASAAQMGPGGMNPVRGQSPLATADLSDRASNGVKLETMLFQDVNVGDMQKYRPEKVGTEEKSKTFGQYQISVAQQPAQITAGDPESLAFTIQKNGKPVKNLEQYLGALGHAIILREGTLDFIHAHAEGHGMSSMTTMSGTVPDVNQEGMKMDTGGPTINFGTSFPDAGKYKIFLQFQHEGKVVTADFVVNVERY